jgi:hypothetical protein
MGVMIDQRSDIAAGVGGNTFIISNNTISNIGVTGLFVFSEVSAIEELNGNVFMDISVSHGGEGRDKATALALIGNGPFLPAVRRARRNRFFGNDTGVLFGNSTNVNFDVNRTIDFGRPDDLGGNVFQCNSGSSALGGDVLVGISGTGAIPFAGNVWDHSPVTTGVEGTAVNGTDINFQEMPSPAIDTTGARTDTSSCPAGRIKGP